MIQFFQQFRGHRELPELGGGRTMGVIDGNILASAFFKEGTANEDKIEDYLIELVGDIFDRCNRAHGIYECQAVKLADINGPPVVRWSN
jgi:hypothetical protein